MSLKLRSGVWGDCDTFWESDDYRSMSRIRKFAVLSTVRFIGFCLLPIRVVRKFLEKLERFKTSRGVYLSILSWRM